MNEDDSRTEVDRIREVYRGYREEGAASVRWSQSNLGNRAILAERRRRSLHLWEQGGFLPLSERRVLDVGCGEGGELAYLVTLGALPENLWGIDLLTERIEAARDRHPRIHFECGNGETLPFEANTFDLLLLFTVLSSILDDRMKRGVAREAARVVRPGGAVLCYEFRCRSPYNPHTKSVPLEALLRLFPGFGHRSVTLTLLPPLARRLGKWTPVLYPTLARFPLLRTHRLSLLRKP